MGAIGSGLRQLVLLLWKNFILQIRSYILTTLIILLPVLFGAMLVWLRTLVDNEIYTEPTTWNKFELIPANESIIDDARYNPDLKLYYYPSNSVTDDIVSAATTHLPTITFLPVSDEAGLQTTMNLLEETQTWSEKHILGIVQFSADNGIFPSDGSIPDMHLTIRLSHSRRFDFYGDVELAERSRDDNWRTDEEFDNVGFGFGPRQDKTPYAAIPPGYYEEGFLSIQMAINLGILSELGHTVDLATDSIQMSRIPYPPYEDNIFNAILNTLLPFTFIISMISLVLLVVKQLVLEKERRLKESMKMMGLQPWTHNIAWLIHFGVIFFIVSIVMSIFLTTKMVEQGAIFQYSSFGGVFLVFLFYSIQAISACFCLSTLFSSANTAAVMGGVIWFFTYFPWLFLDPGNPNGFYDSLNVGTIVLLSFIPNLGFCFSVLMITSLENRGIGLTMSSLGEKRAFNDDLTVGMVFTSQILSSVAYIILTWYLDNVYPGAYGVAKSAIFCFKPSYWCGQKSDSKSDENDLDTVVVDGKQETRNAENFEEDPEGLEVGIHIKNLKKKYGNGKLAVKGVTLKMFEGQITAFLGHNGAGKTTTISLLTGLYEPSSGTAYINGQSIRDNMEEIRKILGICPQHDVLYDQLTVKEHLQLFCRLKGLESKKVEPEINMLLKDLQLENKKNAKACELSGGMKRKLSVAIAFCGGSKVVILDEPTSGMDPSARRATWDLIQKYRVKRTIILTTHYMDEADFLGDRIAIMSSGQLVCAGTSLFLKNRYGIGYHMVTEKTPDCNPDKVLAFISKYVTGAEKESNVGSELSFRLPHEASGNFATMFDDLDKEKDSLGIASYGVSVTTLEEVFMRVGHLNEEDEMANGGSKEEIDSGTKPPSYSSAKTNLAEPRDDREWAKWNKRSSSQMETLHFIKQQRKMHNSMAMNNESYDGVSVDKDLEANGNGTPHNATNSLPSSTINLNGGESADQSMMTSFSTIKPFTEVKRNQGLLLFGQQLQALLVKRFVSTIRSLSLSIAQILVPVFFTTLAIIFLNVIIPSDSDSDPYHFNLDTFEPNKITIYNPGGTFESLEVAYIQALGGTYEIKDASSEADLTKYFGENGKGGVDEFNTHWIVGASFVQDGATNVYTAWFNGEPFHSAPLSLQLLMNGIMREKIGSSFPKISLVNHPLPRTLEEQEENADENSASGFLLSFYMAGIGLGFLMASFSVFLIKERAVKSKHIQMVSGVNTFTYWLCTLVWDFSNYLVTVILLLLIMVAFQVEGWTGSMIGVLLVILLCYGWAILPMMYLLSFMSSVAANGFLVLALINIVGTIGLAITYTVMRSLESSGISTLKVIGAAFPQFSIAACLIDTSNAYKKNEFLKDQGKEETSYFSTDYPGIGEFLLFMICDGFVYWFILLLLEFGVFGMIHNLCCGCCRICRKSSVRNDDKNGSMINVNPQGESREDDDIVKERERILSGTPQVVGETDVLVMQGLEKTYRNACGNPVMKAVHGLYAGISKGECFGLLGVNGAGKSTTFNMLTGDLLIDEGNAFISDINIRNNITAARQQMGYCPQFDALIENMTGAETLTMYGRIRGIPPKQLPTIVAELMEALQLTVYANRKVGTYSGGNKRKISTAIALIGSPPVVFLDEPSSGMDPVTRRKLWNVLSRVREGGQSIIITSHSMEECEALCTRMVIMVNGRFKCLGSLQRLKSRYGSGFTLICKTRSPESPVVTTESNADVIANDSYSDAARLKEHIEKIFPGCILKDSHLTGTIGYLHYELSGQHYKWSQLFSAIEEAKVPFNISDYIISQTTLEQIFLNFAREQKAEYKQT